MSKKVVIIHGWGGSPNQCWFPWLKKELKSKGYIVSIPKMPNTGAPKIKSWTKKLNDTINQPDKELILIGHSIGCQTILRSLETIQIQINKVILIAPWIHLNKEAIEEEGEKAVEIAKPWIETPLNWKDIKNKAKEFICFFSDNDPFVPIENKDIFERELNASIKIEHNKGHFDEESYTKKLDSVLSYILR